MPTTARTDARPMLEDLGVLSQADLLRRCAIGVENLDVRVLHMTDEQLDTAFLPDAGVGRWPARVLLGHLADAEMVLTHRARRIIAEESPVLHVWDEDAFVDGGVYGGASLRRGSPPPNIGGMVATVYTLRAWMCEWLGTLDDVVWRRQGLHPQRGPMTLRQVWEYNTWHLEHHAWYLNAKVERLLGPAPAAGAAVGCGAGCACAPGGTAIQGAQARAPAECCRTSTGANAGQADRDPA